MPAVGEHREVQRHDLKMFEVVGDVLDGFVGLQPDTQAAIARLEGVGVFQPELHRHYHIVAVRYLCQRDVLGQQVPGFVDDLVALNDSLHRRVP